MSSLGNVFIIGDGYSTFDGWIPAGSVAYYPTDAVPNVTRVEQTWWHRLLTETNASLIRNDSYAGTTVCNTGYDGASASDSFVRRMDRLITDGYFQKCRVDTVIIFGGKNDDRMQVPVGAVQYGGWRQEDLRHFGPAYCYMLDRLKMNLPHARIICLEDITLHSMIRASMELACRHYRIDLVHLRNIFTVNGYPDCRGMEQISNQIQLYLLCT